ncbi:GPW/gp25 family protein [Brytella acorum]|uniref:Phage tail protein n=1 Tax=Brytella acorum TaxID=2959299 RepID=A0AA35Y3N6_9PROT|nr:phage tail protein [Brytella acorum]MDF3625098.1 phage tail protein [Brytella acorum]CAI9121023.1 phage tail protein [Brytella acorum]
MNAIAHVMGADLTLAAGTGLSVISGADCVRQKILRRLCTNPGAYIWQLDYGAGLPAMIGDPTSTSLIESIVRAQMALEAGVDQTQPVSVSVEQFSDGGVRCVITYVDAQTQQTQLLSVLN